MQHIASVVAAAVSFGGCEMEFVCSEEETELLVLYSGGFRKI